MKNTRYIDELYYDEIKRANMHFCCCKDHIENKKCPKCGPKKIGPTIIPYSSDGEREFSFELINGVTLTTLSTAIGFGDSALVTIQPTGLINGVDNDGMTAFVLPRAGCLQTLAVSATVTDPSEIPAGTIITIIAQLYKAQCNSSIFAPIPGTQIILAPSITSSTVVGTVFNGCVDNLNYSLNKLERLALVFSVSIPAAVDTEFNFAANLNGGVTIL
ncbi:MAG: hypothetical protein GX895_12465 [Clostridiales bacterium]|uniref:BclA C-terminal domain-containing protein n=1 Tax=Clostridium isatidis TaxID=182773 RepID=A0A343JDA9_9CLOT|nr:hypothetical protein [Clostridium isatidis]ASW43517.1 hypothetical protein BEN51_08490 [Clostridium isatidis]NLZ49562.1 hypothetical protein [Clostridiales bacterium]